MSSSTDFKDQIQGSNLVSSIPVFSVIRCNNLAAKKDENFVFSSMMIPTETKHGEYHPRTGIFAIKTPGTYLFNFHAWSEKKGTRVELCVNGFQKATSLDIGDRERDNDRDELGYQRICISTKLLLKAGDEVGIFAITGELFRGDRSRSAPRFDGHFS